MMIRTILLWTLLISGDAWCSESLVASPNPLWVGPGAMLGILVVVLGLSGWVIWRSPGSTNCLNRRTSLMLLCLPIFAWLAFLLYLNFLNFSGISPIAALLSCILVGWAVGSLFFLMLKSGETDRYRFLFHVFSGTCLLFSIINSVVSVRGGVVGLTAEDLSSPTLPICLIPLPTFLISFLWDRTLIYPGYVWNGINSIGVMAILWLWITPTIGRGWCSWVCPFGAADSFFSRLSKSAWIKNIHLRWSYLPFAVLVVALLVTPLIYAPFYCRVFCPVTKLLEAKGSLTLLSGLGLAIPLFLVVVPLLTKKRTLCTFICPLGAVLSLTRGIVPFSIHIRKDQCQGCRTCIKNCSTLSIDDRSLGQGRVKSSCSRCGQCVDACPSQAMIYHIPGTSLRSSSDMKRYLWLLAACGFGCALTVGAMVKTVFQIMTWGRS